MSLLVRDRFAGVGAAPAREARVAELGQILHAYSEVTERLQRSHEQLQATVERLQNELGEKNRLLERRNRLAALGEMAAGMAHEIRNPLGGIQLYATMLDADLADRPEQRKIVGKISGGVRRLEGLVSNVLQFTREITANRRPCDVRAAVEEAVDLTARQQAAAGVRVEVVGPESLEADADPDLIGRAVLNLVLNAIEAAARRVVVELTPRGGGFSLAVSDDGPGIAPGVIDRLFDPFFTTKDMGTGLGLSIVHRIADAHDGTITASNTVQGGARFELTI